MKLMFQCDPHDGTVTIYTRQVPHFRLVLSGEALADMDKARGFARQTSLKQLTVPRQRYTESELESLAQFIKHQREENEQGGKVDGNSR
jgi:tryptophanase